MPYRKIAVDLNAAGLALASIRWRWLGVFRSRAGPFLGIAAKIQGLDHLEQSIAARVVDHLLRGAAAQVDPTVVTRVLEGSAIVLNLESGAIADYLQLPGVVHNTYAVAIADDPEIARVVLNAVLLAVAHQILAGVDGCLRRRGTFLALIGGFTLLVLFLASGALVIVIRIACRIGFYHTNAHFGVNYRRYRFFPLLITRKNHLPVCRLAHSPTLFPISISVSVAGGRLRMMSNPDG